jgi:hypothetical protein
MVAKHTQFFSTPDEFVQILRGILTGQSLEIFLSRDGAKPFIKKSEVVALEYDVVNFGANRILLAMRGTKPTDITIENINSGQVGLLLVELPRLRNDTLFMGEIAVKTERINSETGLVIEDEDLLKLYNRLTRLFKKHLTFPVWAENMVTGAASTYRDIGYTKAAERFAEKGGNLMQEGVNNVRFTLRKT